jgi:hypothetical protein
MPTPENLRYLTVKRDRLGHQIDGLPAVVNGGSRPAGGTAAPGGPAAAGITINESPPTVVTRQARPGGLAGAR